MKNILHQIIKEEHKHLLSEKGIYQIRNKKNNKVYIGSTSIKFSSRLSCHIKNLIENKHHSIHLQNTFNQSRDFSIFEISILEICSPENCIKLEQKWIDFYKSYNDKLGYNISPTAGSCFGIKRSKEQKIKQFEIIRELTDEQIIEMFHLRNKLQLNNMEISNIMNIKANQISSVLNRLEKYKYVKEKYNLKLEIKNEKKFTKEDIIKIHDMYENKKMSICDICEVTNFDRINIRHLICNKKLYKEERGDLKFNFEKKRKDKIYKKTRRKGIKVNKKIIPEEKINIVFDSKHNLNLSESEISEKLKIKEKEVYLILSFKYQRRKYNKIYLDLKTQYDIRSKRNLLIEEDIIGIFNDYNSGEYLIVDLNRKYNYNDVGILLNKRKTISEYYKKIIDKNNLSINKSLTKNISLKSISMTETNKKRSKIYKLIDPNGFEMIIKNLAEFCKDKNLDPGNLSRISKNSKTYKGWKCICLE
jgi:group I intron endonuclease